MTALTTHHLCLRFQPTQTEQRYNEQLPSAQKNIQQFHLLPNREWFLCFQEKNSQIQGFATNLPAILFRYLMLFCPAFSNALIACQTTDYWGYDLRMPDIFKIFSPIEKSYQAIKKQAFKGRLSHKALAHIESALANIHAFIIGHPHAFCEQASGQLDAKRKKHYHLASDCKQYPYSGDYNSFIDPGSTQSKIYVAKQITAQLKDLDVVSLNQHHKERRHALFIGVGTGENMQQILKQYPMLVAVGLEPLTHSYQIALTQSQINKQLLLMTDLEHFIRLTDNQYRFHYIFVLNYNVLSAQDNFFRCCKACLAEDGQLIVGVAKTDPRYIASPETIDTLFEKYYTHSYLDLAPNPSAQHLAYYKLKLYLANASDQRQLTHTPCNLSSHFIHYVGLLAEKEEDVLFASNLYYKKLKRNIDTFMGYYPSVE